MQFKAKYKGKTKKLNAKTIQDYATLRAAIERTLKGIAPDDFQIYYFEQGDPIDVQNQDDYQALAEAKQKVTLYLKQEDEDYIAFEDTSVIMPKSVDMLSDSFKREEENFINSIKQKKESENEVTHGSVQKLTGDFKKHKVEAKQQISQPEVKVQPESKTKHQNPSVKETPTPEQSKPKQQSKLDTIFQQKGSIKESQEPQKAEQPSTQISIHKGTKCQTCKTSQIKGPRWKCLICVDYDICQECYRQAKYKKTKQHKNKDHQFIQIKDDTFWQRVNFTHSIRKLFNQKYQISKQDGRVGEWLTENDIASNNLNFVKQIWCSSQDAAAKIIEGFEQWQKEYEAVKST